MELTDEFLDNVWGSTPWQDLDINKLVDAGILRRRFARRVIKALSAQPNHSGDDGKHVAGCGDGEDCAACDRLNAGSISQDGGDERAQFDAWLEKRGVWPRLTHFEIWQAALASKVAPAPQESDILSEILSPTGQHALYERSPSEVQICAISAAASLCESCGNNVIGQHIRDFLAAQSESKAAPIASTEETPVAWMWRDGGAWELSFVPDDGSKPAGATACAALYTHPSQSRAEIPDEVGAFLGEVHAELRRARAKFPGDRIMTIALAEEFGELCKAVLDESRANVRKEAIQTAVMAARIVLDGDGSVNEWRAERGLDKLIEATK